MKRILLPNIQWKKNSLWIAAETAARKDMEIDPKMTYWDVQPTKEELESIWAVTTHKAKVRVTFLPILTPF